MHEEKTRFRYALQFDLPTQCRVKDKSLPEKSGKPSYRLANGRSSIFSKLSFSSVPQRNKLSVS
jgi:hypothetical protein